MATIPDVMPLLYRRLFWLRKGSMFGVEAKSVDEPAGGNVHLDRVKVVYEKREKGKAVTQPVLKWPYRVRDRDKLPPMWSQREHLRIEHADPNERVIALLPEDWGADRHRSDHIARRLAGEALNTKEAEAFWALVPEGRKSFRHCHDFVNAAEKALRSAKGKTLKKREKDLREYESWLEHIRDLTPDRLDYRLGDLLRMDSLAAYRSGLETIGVEVTPRLTEVLDAVLERLQKIPVPVPPTVYMKDRMRLAFKLARAMRRHLQVKPTNESVISLMATICPHRIPEKGISNETVERTSSKEIETLSETMRRGKWFPDRYRRWKMDKKMISRAQMNQSQAAKKADRAIRAAQAAAPDAIKNGKTTPS